MQRQHERRERSHFSEMRVQVKLAREPLQQALREQKAEIEDKQQLPRTATTKIAKVTQEMGEAKSHAAAHQQLFAHQHHQLLGVRQQLQSTDQERKRHAKENKRLLQESSDIYIQECNQAPSATPGRRRER